MAYSPHKDKMIDGRSNKKPPESVPIDKDGFSLQRQYDPQPPWGTKTEAALRAKRSRSSAARSSK